MTQQQIVDLIPARYRDEILLGNMISSATASTTDKTMQYLATVWNTYVSPGTPVECNSCMVSLLQKWGTIQVTLIEDRKARLLLQSLQPAQ